MSQPASGIVDPAGMTTSAKALAFAAMCVGMFLSLIHI